VGAVNVEVPGFYRLVFVKVFSKVIYFERLWKGAKIAESTVCGRC